MYKRTWKVDTLKACGLIGTRRAVLHALVTLADFAGRSHRPYREIAVIAGVSVRACASALHYLVETGFVHEIQRGRGRAPSWLQVVACEAKE